MLRICLAVLCVPVAASSTRNRKILQGPAQPLDHWLHCRCGARCQSSLACEQRPSENAPAPLLHSWLFTSIKHEHHSDSDPSAVGTLQLPGISLPPHSLSTPRQVLLRWSWPDMPSMARPPFITETWISVCG